MGRKRTSPVWTNFTKREFQELLDTSCTIADVIRKIGLSPYNGNHKTVRKRIEEEGLSTEALSKNREEFLAKHLKKLHNSRRATFEEIFSKENKCSRNTVRRNIIKNDIIPYRCCLCGINPEWNNKPLSLQLDHINGINDDNRIENLRFLCPNCHSQTDTFSNKRSKKTRYCQKCNVRKTTSMGAKFCEVCHNEDLEIRSKKMRKFDPGKEVFLGVCEKLNWNFCAIGRYYRVSDNAIRKRLKHFKNKA